MRISGGVMKGRKVKEPLYSHLARDEKNLRPTSSKVREALFDILRSRIAGATFLDLYSGTGAVGIEALSRGASFVFFVEANQLRAKMIERILEKYGLHEKSKIVKGNAEDFILHASGRGIRFSLIYIDPPYHTEELLKILPLVGLRKILEPGGIVIAEHFVKMKLPERITGLVFMKSYRYGDSILSLFEMEESA